jgi:hypothetical protein
VAHPPAPKGITPPKVIAHPPKNPTNYLPPPPGRPGEGSDGGPRGK